MRNHRTPSRRKTAAGFTLPSILVVVGALLILAVGLLLVVGIERNTARSFVDRQRAALAARAGLEDVKGIFNEDASNDDYLILQSTLPPVEGAPPTTIQSPQLFLARGKPEEGNYKYTPLFSTLEDKTVKPTETLSIPEVEPLVGKSETVGFNEFQTLPYQTKSTAAWKPVLDSKGKMVGRYSYWVEDLQSRVDAGSAGNTEDGGKHKRYGWKKGDTSKFAKFPAPGLNPEPSEPDDATGRDKKPPLNQVALYSLDPKATTAQDSTNITLDNTIIDGRKALISPDSTLAVAGVVPPLVRDKQGILTDELAKAVEENLTAEVQPYDEQPVVPFATGIDKDVVGKPKLNLNALIAKSPDAAVEEMAAWIRKALPGKKPTVMGFDDRKGGFPEDYVKTIAANAVGYAASGNKPVVQMGSYRGLGASPMFSEILLTLNYIRKENIGRSDYLNFEFELFAELLNHTNLPISGKCQLSYEVGLNLPRVGSTPTGVRFDDRGLLLDKNLNPNDLIQDGARFWTQPVSVDLQPGQYRFYKFAKVTYRINIGATGKDVGQDFSLVEPMGSAGLSMKWNDKEVERIPTIVRDSTGLKYLIGYARYFGKAAIPGHSYGPYGTFINNMGDPRIAQYMTTYPLGENAFPENISPNRRNIRWDSVYKLDSPTKTKTYGRVVPSEWPDGGHDCEVTQWTSGWSEERQGSIDIKNPKAGTGPGFDPTPNAPYKPVKGETMPVEGEAITYLSDRKRYYSATELGRLYDPIMWLPTFDPKSKLDSTILRKDGTPVADAGVMPAAGVSWPLVQVGNLSSQRFGGGNTLRIGRPEHPKFNLSASGSVDHTPAEMPATHAARLLDLFHAGKSRSDDAKLREGELVRIEGHVNINTASRDALRSMAAGLLVMDPKLSRRTSTSYDGKMAPPVSALTSLSNPTAAKEADIVADAIIKGRPYSSPSELACVRNPDGKEVFGNADLYPEKENIQWNDAAAEEAFGRVYEASTIRSRNFRVWVVGQAVSPTDVANSKPEVLSEVRRAYTVFADPGERASDGKIQTANYRTRIIHENDF